MGLWMFNQPFQNWISGAKILSNVLTTRIHPINACNRHNKRRWSSGRISACHAGDPEVCHQLGFFSNYFRFPDETTRISTSNLTIYNTAQVNLNNTSMTSSRALIYSTVGDVEIGLDLFIPTDVKGNRPLVVFYHGGGLVCGSKKDFIFPQWLLDRSLSRGYFFVTADHRLLAPATAHDIVEDVKSLSHFLHSEAFSAALPAGSSVDFNRVAVFGVSAGAYCARLAAIHFEPKPVALVSLYGMGGDQLHDHWLTPNPEFEFLGEKNVGHEELIRFFEGPTVTSSPVEFIPGQGLVVKDGRTKLFAGGINHGDFLDLFTGVKGLSDQLRPLPRQQRDDHLPSHLRPLFPHLYVDAFPPTFLVHGDEDLIVLPAESEHTEAQLKKLGRPVESFYVKDAVHGLMAFNGAGLAAGAEEAFEKMNSFIAKYLK
ncbi:hypothetical protein PROFUN_07551 [Planoprotostelium fungivorum]|uniref:Alpha/beta hydrolase fold-3 domain-containing protein n=1 Tax=Planoprotostelium fungivorum TaxID=1890364 RepID=A0A2P6NLQ9_9EUKA|nr:hypothetical protein PROFUN_07551 [Planoprotostelium fungivorum]